MGLACMVLHFLKMFSKILVVFPLEMNERKDSSVFLLQWNLSIVDMLYSERTLFLRTDEIMVKVS